MGGGDEFVWRSGRAEVTLSLVDETWTVVYTSVGRLLGPRTVLHEGRHRDATFAAWDVMARVSHASKNEADVVEAGHLAAQWIKARRTPPPGQGHASR